MLEQTPGPNASVPLPPALPEGHAPRTSVDIRPVGLPAPVLRELQMVLFQLGSASRLRGRGEPATVDAITVVMASDVLSQRGSDPSHIDRPMIAIVGRDLPDVERLLEQGFIDYITYPFSPLEIRRRLLGLPPAERGPLIKVTPSLSDRVIMVACSAMEERLDLTPCVERLALKAGTNRTTLNRVFNERFRMGPITWLRHRRCEEAAKMLRIGEGSILSIALSVGYTDANNFSTAFRRIYGVSPKEYRRKLQLTKI